MPSHTIIPGVDDNLALALKYEARFEEVRVELRRYSDGLREVGAHYPIIPPLRIRMLSDEYRTLQLSIRRVMRDAEVAERAHYG